jgi:hypothetical protein
MIARSGCVQIAAGASADTLTIPNPGPIAAIFIRQTCIQDINTKRSNHDGLDRIS